ncbi:hypothetical protein SPPR111872_19600 [Sphingobacterium prati]
MAEQYVINGFIEILNENKIIFNSGAMRDGVADKL